MSQQHEEGTDLSIVVSSEAEQASIKFFTVVASKLDELEMSVSDFCELLGIKKATFYGARHRNGLPTIETCARIAIVLDLPLNDLLSPLVPGDTRGWMREYAQRKKKAEELRSAAERAEIEMNGVLKKFRIGKDNQ